MEFSRSKKERAQSSIHRSAPIRLEYSCKQSRGEKYRKVGDEIGEVGWDLQSFLSQHKEVKHYFELYSGIREGR